MFIEETFHVILAGGEAIRFLGLLNMVRGGGRVNFCEQRVTTSFTWG